ncbi:MAG: CDP-alcohol phosphatidyltransferase family protein, partial [Oscillospiraceae bacterium]
MNLPNKLTLLRMALVPVFVVLLMTDCPLAALLVFVGASLTDLLDGKIARARGLVTTFGKLMDPLADKILVMSAMLCFVELGWAPAFVVIIIL